MSPSKPTPAPTKTSTPVKTTSKAEVDVSAPTLAAAVAGANARNPNMTGETDTSTMSSVGAELAPEANTYVEDGMTVLEAGGDNVAAAPLPTPAEAVAYPATGGLPDTGPNSKYAVKEVPVVELFNRDGQRVDRDGRPIDAFGDRIPHKGADEVLKTSGASSSAHISQTTKAEMDAGRKALGAR
jgi:hypothetical protein